MMGSAAPDGSAMNYVCLEVWDPALLDTRARISSALLKPLIAKLNFPPPCKFSRRSSLPAYASPSASSLAS
jgi:hypothetical protein